MFKLWKGSWLVAMVVACNQVSSAAADDGATKVMENWVGNWTGVVAGGEASRGSGGLETTGTAKVVWTLGGKFLQGTNSDAAGKPTGIWMMKFDAEQGQYEVYFFTADGSVSVWRGIWSGANRTMNWKGTGSDGKSTLTGYTKFSDGRQEWQLELEQDGKVTTHHGSLTRK